jgi:hypothetical protein
MPGKPIRFEAVSDRGGDSQAPLITGTVSITGAFGLFIQYMGVNRPPKSVYFYTPRGRRLDAPTLNAADFAAID